MGEPLSGFVRFCRISLSEVVFAEAIECSRYQRADLESERYHSKGNLECLYIMNFH